MDMFSVTIAVTSCPVWVTPVSYTHLDVYKRQGKCPALDSARHTPGDVPLDGLNGLFQRIQVAGPEGYHQHSLSGHRIHPLRYYSLAFPDARYSMALQIQAATLDPPFRPRATI